MIKTYEDALNFIHGRTQHKKIPTLKRMKKFLSLLGDPQETVQSIHVAGTNGKGSTVAFLRQMLVAAGYGKVGTFTSPFLIRFNERISINGQPIPDADLVRITQMIEPVVARLDRELPTGGPTEFEIDTALMWLYFAQQKVDVAVVEVGVGGALDSTNIIAPVVSVIVSVGMDHMELLGDSLMAIAYQKAGIMRKDVPVVTGHLDSEAMEAIKKSSQLVGSPLYRLGYEFQAVSLPLDHSWHESFDYRFAEQKLQKVQLSLIGHHQINNAAVALAACQLFMEKQGKRFEAQKMRQALSTTTWPGRFEPVSFSPLVILDGAHNEPAIKELVRTLREHFPQQKITLILAILADKEYKKMINEVQQLPHSHVILTRFNGPGKRAVLDPSRLKVNNQQIEVQSDWHKAINDATKAQVADEVLLITGSLYFISTVRKFFERKNRVPAANE
ncbi:folylpolyglutamate synthase/dihydrofolate synthase family protein [Enterococcus faecium]|uniref:folylpolyglutamate synthase/dihydrofolate synthase family protein n=3 Tax=Enterococcus faecium TaxID=1352 RepID=UPI0034A49D82